MRYYDLVVLGTGTAGSTVAFKCSKAGWKVAMVESGSIGGTCALRGCDPKKVLVGAADVVDWSRRMEGLGVLSHESSLDWQALMKFKRTFTEPVSEGKGKAIADAGIDTLHGVPRFTDDGNLAVGDETLQARHFHIATGARPATLNIPGEELLTDSEQFLELEHLPERIVFVGGGYISFEFAHVAARAGAQVTILHRGDRPLEGFDADLVASLAEATKDAGIELRLGTSVASLERNGSEGIKVHAEGGAGPYTCEADLVIHGAGREASLDDMDLEKVGVRYSRRGIEVNQYLQSVSNPVIYAAGDVAATHGSPLTPVAAMEAHAVAANLLEGNSRTPDYRAVPSVVFTLPPLATVGLREEAAKQQGRQFRVQQGDSAGWATARRVGLKHAAYKILIEEDTDRILGAHLLGLHAEEVINLFAMAMRADWTTRDLKQMPYAYPSSASDISHML